MTGAKRTHGSSVLEQGDHRHSMRLWTAALVCVSIMTMPLRLTAAAPIPAASSPDGGIQPDQFVDPDLYCEYQITRVDTDPHHLATPPFDPHLLSLLPTVSWNNLVRVYVECWIPRRSWSNLRHLLEGRYHDRLFGMIANAYLVEHLQRSTATSLNDLSLYQYLLDCYSRAPEKGQKAVPKKISEEVRLGIGAQLIARALRDDGIGEIDAPLLPALWKKAAPTVSPPEWSSSTLTQLQLLTDEALAMGTPFWRRSVPIQEGDSFLLQRYACYRGPSSAIGPRPLTRAWDLLHLRSINNPCNDLSPGTGTVDRTHCPPSTLMWEKIAGQSRIQHTIVTARYGKHNGVEGTRVTMDWIWDFNYVMLPFNLQIVKDTIRAYFRSLIRGFYTLPRE
jgi:hypothetical protein